MKGKHHIDRNIPMRTVRFVHENKRNIIRNNTPRLFMYWMALYLEKVVFSQEEGKTEYLKQLHRHLNHFGKKGIVEVIMKDYQYLTSGWKLKDITDWSC